METTIDGRVLAFTFGVSMMATLLFSLAPAFQASRIDLHEALKQSGARAVVGRGAGRMRQVLVVAEIALSVVLLAGAGLLIKSFVALHNVALGFRPEHVLVMDSSVPASDSEGERRAAQFFRRLLADVRSLPAYWLRVQQWRFRGASGRAAAWGATSCLRWESSKHRMPFIPW